MALKLIKKLFARDDGRDALSAFYAALVAEARNPAWYRDGQVADTMDGRFEMVAALTALAIARLDAEGEAGRVPAVMLTEIFVDDMDAQLREIGVGDMIVGKRIGKLLGAFGGRLGAYREALADGAQPGLLNDALTRNLYGDVIPTEAQLAHVADALRTAANALLGTDAADVAAGRATW